MNFVNTPVLTKIPAKHGIYLLISAALILSVLSAPVAAQIGERIILFRSIEDASTPPDPAVCAEAPFSPVTVRLGASLWSFEMRSSDGMVVNDQAHRLGNATACAQVTNLAFPLFTTSPFYVKFSLADGEYVGQGSCTIINNDILTERPILAGCTLRLESAPSEVLGGAATSMSVFNPFRISDFNTGSIWTLHLYINQT